MKPSPIAFKITKNKIHNPLQGTLTAAQAITQVDINNYNNWVDRNISKHWKKKFATSDVIILDDPQVSGLCRYIKAKYPKTKVVYRNHIHIRTELLTEGSPAKAAWDFVWSNIQSADLFVFHPVLESFVPDCIPREKLVYIPACTDPLDGLNKPLSSQDTLYYISLFHRLSLDTTQKPQTINPDDPILIQVARFDPSKGINDLIDVYFKVKSVLPKVQLIICGNGALDDPDGNMIYEKTLVYLEEYPVPVDYKKDVYVARLPHIDQLMNALLTISTVVLQLSWSEGYEVKVTEALMKGKPVVVYNTGGIPKQVKQDINGFIVERGDTSAAAAHCVSLLTDQDLYNRMSNDARKTYEIQATLPYHFLQTLQLISTLVNP
jgi:glycosyltransferase involved in cell wall biosynthesis